MIPVNTVYVYCINNLEQQTVEFCRSCRRPNINTPFLFYNHIAHCGAMHAFECAPFVL